MRRDRAYWFDLLERVLVTFAQGFIVAACVVAGVDLSGDLTAIALPGFDDLFSLPTLQGGIVGGVLALAKGFLAGSVGARNSAALLPSPPDVAPPVEPGG